MRFEPLFVRGRVMFAELPFLQGVLAHRQGLLTAEQLIQAVTLWADDPQQPDLLGWLQGQGWLAGGQRR